jgi:hypothetical protein
MPIKFRCSYCNQFLGISRAQSGGVVDCPSCGRSIRVPNLDGTVAPLPKPAIDLNDDSLATALDQLAALEHDVETVASAAPIRNDLQPVMRSAPVAPVAVPQTVTLEASPSDAAVPSSSSSTRPWIEVEEQLASLASGAPRHSAPGAPTGLNRRDALVAGATAITIGPVMWWLGGRSNNSKTSADDLKQAAAAPGAPEKPAAPAAIAEAAPALTGRITYVTADGESRPDAGARILLLPELRPGSTLLSVDGFRANAAAADVQLAQDALKLLGGAFTSADEQGRYGADLSSSGVYEILIVSNYQSRPAGPLPEDLLKALSRFFDRPQQLVGQTAYEFTHIRFTGRESSVRDQVFQRV